MLPARADRADALQLTSVDAWMITLSAKGVMVSSFSRSVEGSPSRPGRADRLRGASWTDSEWQAGSLIPVALWWTRDSATSSRTGVQVPRRSLSPESGTVHHSDPVREGGDPHGVIPRSRRQNSSASRRCSSWRDRSHHSVGL